MADVIAIVFVADRKTTCIVCYSIRRWQMLLPGGRWNSHCRVVDVFNHNGRWYSHGSMTLFNFQFWDVKQNLIPYVWQMVFASVSLLGWIVDPNV